MATVSEVIAELNKFDPNAAVNGAESLTVSVVSQTPVLPTPPAEETPA